LGQSGSWQLVPVQPTAHEQRATPLASAQNPCPLHVGSAQLGIHDPVVVEYANPSLQVVQDDESKMMTKFVEED
jgi:hypothetical protein